MSTHLWDTKRFSESTVETVLRAVRVALGGGADYEAAARFAGYNAEAIRQRGFRDGYYEQPGGATTPAIMWRNAARSGHRYARGRNRDYYLDAARRVLAQATGMKPDTPLYVVWDKLIDDGLLPT